MTAVFHNWCSAKLDQFAIELEEEDVEAPAGYDMGGPPPAIRIRLRLGDASFFCDSIDGLSALISQTRFPMEAFCERFPQEIIQIISYLRNLGRPITDHELFQFFETDYDIAIKDLRAVFDGGVLSWYEYSSNSKPPVRPRALSLNPLRLVES